MGKSVILRRSRRIYIFPSQLKEIKAVLQKSIEVSAIITKCAWCGRILKRGPGKFPGDVSHGICPACNKKIFSGYKAPTENSRSDPPSRLEKIISLSKQMRLQDEQLIMEQAGLEKDIEKLFKQARLLQNKHFRLIFIKAARQAISSVIKSCPAGFGSWR